MFETTLPGSSGLAIFRSIKIIEGDASWFPLHSGGSSPVLFDVMAMMGDDKTLDFIVDSLRSRITADWHRLSMSSQMRAIAGIELGGAVLAGLIAHKMGLSLVVVRKDGTTSHKAPPPDHPVHLVTSYVALIDDVITTGASIDAAEAALKAAGWSVLGPYCVVDRRPPILPS